MWDLVEWILSIVTGSENLWIELRPGAYILKDLYNKAEVQGTEKYLSVHICMILNVPCFSIV